MAGFRAERAARGAKEHPRGNAVRGRVQQRRNRFLSSGGCPAESVAKVVLPVSRDEELVASGTVNATSDGNLESLSNNWPRVMPTFVEPEGHDTTDSLLSERLDIPTLVNSPEQCNKIIDKFEIGDTAQKHTLLLQLHGNVRQLALSKNGCRIVQKAFEVAGGPDRDVMIAELKGHITELYESPHGNHVLSKAIEVLPAATNRFIITPLLGRGLAVSKHRFGCRVICRLVEHCGEDQIAELLDEVLTEASYLARHAFGNFVVQTAFEHTSHARRSAMLSQLLPGFATLAMHRTGSLVAQRALDYSTEVGQNLAIQALLQGEDGASIVDVACNRYGSYVIEQLAGMRHDAVLEIGRILAVYLQCLHSSEHAERVIMAFGFAPAELLAPVA